MLKNSRGGVIILGLVAWAIGLALVASVISYSQGKKAGDNQAPKENQTALYLGAK